MADYDAVQLARACKKAGFSSGGGLVNAIALSLGEDTSRLLRATFTNPDGSIDRGPFQINSRWHSEVPDSCAFNLECSATQAYRISRQGTDFSPWTAWTNGRYRQFLDLAYTAAAVVNLQDQLADLQAQLATANDLAAQRGAAIVALTQEKLDLQAQLATANAAAGKAQTDLAAALAALQDERQREATLTTAIDTAVAGLTAAKGAS